MMNILSALKSTASKLANGQDPEGTSLPKRNQLVAVLMRMFGGMSEEEEEKKAKAQVEAPTTQAESMNYHILKQKLFEAVSKEDMPCNKPRASTRPGKKKMVKACEGGKEKIVHFGAKGYGHNYSPKARKSFKARHKCGEKKSKLSAQYWACKNLWAGPKGSKASCPSNRQCKK
jgi:hypothetical protein